MKEREYQICTKTIMDTSDPNIIFDEEGICDYYHHYKSTMEPSWLPNEEGLKKLELISENIKKDQNKKEFDCIIGLSGSLDSSYTVYVAKEIMGLNPLVYHVDAGWNTQQAVSNIEKLLNGLNLELFTDVIDWSEMRDVQLAFFKSGISDQDLPQDYAFFSSMYKFAWKNNIKYILTGSNISTECCREPMEWGGYGPGVDATFFNDIYKKFGGKPLNTFPIVDILRYRVFYMGLLGMKVVKPLDLVPFFKKEAEDFLEEKFGWERFQHKHHESRFTRFYEDYWLPRRFGYEKRRAHFSSLILTGQMTRDEALDRISRPELDEKTLKNEFEYVANKLDITVSELEAYFNLPKKTYKDYKNKKWIINLGTQVLFMVGKEKRLFR